MTINVNEYDNGREEGSRNRMVYLSEKEFLKLVQDQLPRLLLYARQFVKDRQEAESILQEALIRLWREGYNPKYSLLQQLYVRVRSAALDYLRKEHRRIKREQLYLEVHQQDNWFHPNSLDEQNEIHHIEQALHQLPENQREVVILKIWGGLTFQEIANTLGESLGTIASRYQLALKKLKHLLSSKVPL